VNFWTHVVSRGDLRLDLPFKEDGAEGTSRLGQARRSFSNVRGQIVEADGPRALAHEREVYDVEELALVGGCSRTCRSSTGRPS
jgi:hypothetical protein